MKICKEAEGEKNCSLNTVEHNGSYFVNPAVGVASASAMSFFSYYKLRHEWIIITTNSGAIFCIEFANPDNPSSQTKPKIEMSFHKSKESANLYGAKGIGDESCHIIHKEMNTKNETLGDVINYLNECDQNYRLFSNNCQDLASGFYAKFAKIHVEELRQDLHKRYNTPGLSRGIDDSVTVTCTLF